MHSQLDNVSTKDEAAALRREAGSWLKERREAVGLSQRELAVKVGIEYYTFISQIEAGRGRVPAERYEAYANALGINPREFTLIMLSYNEPAIYRLLQMSAKPEAAPAPEKSGSVIVDLEKRLSMLESMLIK